MDVFHFSRFLVRYSLYPVTFLKLAFSAMELEMSELSAKSYRSAVSKYVIIVLFVIFLKPLFIKLIVLNKH